VLDKVTGCRKHFAGSLLFWLKDEMLILSCPGNLRSFRIDTPTVESIIDNLSYGRNVWVDVHAITSSEVTKNALGGNFQHGTGKLRKAPSLYVINSLKPLNQRQTLVKIHDSLLSPSKSLRIQFPLTYIDASKNPRDANSSRFLKIFAQFVPLMGRKNLNYLSEKGTIARLCVWRYHNFVNYALNTTPSDSC